VNLELMHLTGASTRLQGTVTVPAKGQVARFLDQVEGFESLRSPFEGVLRITTGSSAGVTVVGLRARYNEDGDFLMASTPAVDENAPASASEMVFPHWADGGGYTSQFIILNPMSARSSGTLRLFSPSGHLLDMGLR
jgi:hypothetical protein